MKPSRIILTAILFIPIIMLVFSPFPASGQPDRDMTEGPGKSPQAEEFDKKAMEKLESMSPEDVAELDKKLAEALTLFYDREYARALPIFREISDVVETLDVLFWYGSCAAKAGKSDLAIQKFKRMLDIDPTMLRVRLELATVYYELGRYEDAKRELRIVLGEKPPKTVVENIKKLMSSIEAKTKRVFANVRVSAGIQRDTDVNSAPDEAILYLPSNGGLFGTGGTLTLQERQKSLKDWVAVDSFAGNILYDMGDSKEWMWNTTGSFYQSHPLQYHEFGLTQGYMSSGPWYVKDKGVLKIPFGYAKNWYGHDDLYDNFSVYPSYEYFFRNNFSVRGTVIYSQDDYVPGENQPQENINRTFEIGPNLFFNNRRDILSFAVSDENLNADAPRYSYDGVNAAVSYYRLLKMDMEVYARFRYSKRDYLGQVPLWPYNREDRRYNFYAVLSRNFLKYYFVSISYNYINNNSNTGLYDFDKHVYGVSIGFKWNN